MSRSVLPRFKALVVAEDPREPFDQAVKRRQENERAFRRQVEQYLENLLTTIATDPTGPSGIGSLPVGAAVGDLIYGSAIDTWSRKAIGSAGYWLRAGTTPDWTAPAALTKSDDTNVTLTLGGSASTALLNAASLTLGWVGTLGPTRGGTGTGTVAAGDLLHGSGVNTWGKLAIGTQFQFLRTNSGATAAEWATNLKYENLPTGGGTWANGGALSITGGITTVAGLTSTADVTVGSVIISQATAKITLDGTDGTVAAGSNGIVENAGNLQLSTRGAMQFQADNDANGAQGFGWGDDGSYTNLMNLTSASGLVPSVNIVPSTTDTYSLGTSSLGFKQLFIQHTTNQGTGLILRSTATGFGSPRIMMENTVDWAGHGTAINNSASDTLTFYTGTTAASTTGTNRMSLTLTSLDVQPTAVTGTVIVSLGSGATTQAQSAFFKAYAGTNTGANDKDAAFSMLRGGTELWRHGVLGSLVADSNWTLRDVVNGVSAIIVTPAATNIVTVGSAARLVLANTQDISGTSATTSAFAIGDVTGTHIAMDNNEIMAKASATTTSVLSLNADGGNLTVGSNRTTEATTLSVIIRCGDNAGANDQTVVQDWAMGTTTRWRAGMTGSVNWRLLDVVNNLSIITAAPSATLVNPTINSGTTTGAVSAALVIRSGTNAGANDKDAYVIWDRGGTALWHAGILGSVSTDGGWRLYNASASRNILLVTAGATSSAFEVNNGITTSNLDAVVRLNAGTDSGANDRDAYAEILRGGTALWRVGMLGSSSTSGSFVIYDVANTRRAVTYGGGVLAIDPDITTSNLGAELRIRGATNAGANDKDIFTSYYRSSTELWRHGVLGSTSADTVFSIRDQVNSLRVMTVHPSSSVVDVRFAGDITTGSISTSLKVNAGSNSGTNDKDASVLFSRAQTNLWEAGVLGSVAANASWTLRDRVNSSNALVITQGATPAITTGLWNATKIGLAYGGTNADLSATGGASQVLKQVSAGAAVTVAQLAFTDISGNLAYSQLPTGGGTWANGGALSITGGVTTVAGLSSSADPGITLTAAASRIVPGATSLALRNNANSADNLIITDAGAGTFRAGVTATTAHFTGALTADAGIVLTGAVTGTGTWTAAKVGLAYGGTNADLSGTGAASNVLQQASAGAAITVGQLAFSDISSTLAFAQLPVSTGAGGTWSVGTGLSDILTISATKVIVSAKVGATVTLEVGTGGTTQTSGVLKLIAGDSTGANNRDTTTEYHRNATRMWVTGMLGALADGKFYIRDSVNAVQVMGITAGATPTTAFTGHVSSSVDLLSPILDSGSATDLLLKRNAVTQLTLGSLAGTFAGYASSQGMVSSNHPATDVTFPTDSSLVVAGDYTVDSSVSITIPSTAYLLAIAVFA